MRLKCWSSWLGGLCLTAALALPIPAHAFGLSGFGAKVGVMEPEDLDGTLAVAGHLEFEQPGSPVHLLPSVMYWNSDDVSDLSANADLYYHFVPEGVVTPYVGGGLGIHSFNNDRTNRSNTDLGANVFGGVRFPASSSHYFVEGRFTASDISQFAILGGITFHSRGGQ